MLYDIGRLDLIRKYLDNGIWIAAIGSAACIGLFLVLTVILIIARVIAWAWGWS
jgi:hypothetical protein